MLTGTDWYPTTAPFRCVPEVKGVQEIGETDYIPLFVYHVSPLMLYLDTSMWREMSAVAAWTACNSIKHQTSQHGGSTYPASSSTSSPTKTWLHISTSSPKECSCFHWQRSVTWNLFGVAGICDVITPTNSGCQQCFCCLNARVLF